jgi:hypothetical protein
MPSIFRSLLPLLFGLALGAQVPAPAPVAGALTARQHHDIRCAAAFAVVAVGQTRGNPAALALPPLGIRGKRYLGLVGERVAAQTGLTGEAVRDLLADAARTVAHDGAPVVAAACLGELDGAVPPHPAPDAVACVVMLGVYADVLAARAGDSKLRETLVRESARLAPAAHALLAARGLDPAGEAAAIDTERARVREALNGGPASVDADDFALCRRLAATKTG